MHSGSRPNGSLPRFGYQPRLGLPWFQVLSLPVYYPWRLFEWWYAFDAYAPTVFNKSGILAASSGVAGIAVAVIGSLWRARQCRLATTYGSSRWASRPEVEAAGLFRPAGVFLGELKDRYLRHDGPEHVMAFASTRSGKGVGLVIPTLLSSTGSTMVHDIKGENWRLTAGWRARFSHCLLFNPTNPRSAWYNPLLDAIHDNWHVRIAFSSNDERTAKRMSDALGTATELRLQRNLPGTDSRPGSVTSWSPARKSSPTADAGRGDATAAGGRADPGLGPGADSRPEATLLRRP